MPFVDCLTSRQPQHMAGPSARSLRRHHQWCWNIEPRIPVTGQVYDEVQVDGIYLRSGWCALIAIADQQVIGWQWCDREKQASWAALLARFPAPCVVVTDGQAGILGRRGPVLAHHPGPALPGPRPAQRAHLPHPAAPHRCRTDAARVVVVPDQDHHPRRREHVVDQAERLAPGPRAPDPATHLPTRRARRSGPVLLATTPRPVPKKDSGPARAGLDALDTPGTGHIFLPLTR